MRAQLIFAFTLVVLLGCFQGKALSSGLVISGTVTDKSTGERLIGVNVFCPEARKGTITNPSGYFFLFLPRLDSARVYFSYTGYETLGIDVGGGKLPHFEIQLVPGIELGEVEIVGLDPSRINQSRQVGALAIPVTRLALIPVLGGEPDVMKGIQSMPGFSQGNEGSAQVFARGGNHDQNLVLVDGIPIYYLNHLGGYVSVLHQGSIKAATVYKGGFPARYGGRLSSVMDIQLKDGNRQDFQGEASLGLVSAYLALEGPIKKGVSSYYISTRRFMYDLLMKPVTRILTKGAALGYTFYDVYAKVNHEFGNNNTLSLSFYNGRDHISTRLNDKENKQKTKDSRYWGNTLVATRWECLLAPGLHLDSKLSFSRYQFRVNYFNRSDDSQAEHDFLSTVQDISVTSGMEYSHGSGMVARVGVTGVSRTFLPASTSYSTSQPGYNPIDTVLNRVFIPTLEYSMYSEIEYIWKSLVLINLGARYSGYLVEGFHEQEVEPRVVVKIYPDKQLDIGFAYSKMVQPLHLVSNSGTGMPADLWLPANQSLPPGKSHQVSMALDLYPRGKKYSYTIDMYYKGLYNLVDYKEGISFFAGSRNWQSSLESGGKGHSFGLELLLQKKEGQTNGWLSASFSRTTRKFQEINEGKMYLFTFDRPFDVGLYLIHKINQRVSLSGAWVCYAGNRLTIPVARYPMVDIGYEVGRWAEQPEGVNYEAEVYIYEGKNNYRMKPYHRLDAGLHYTKPKTWGESKWSFSIYNVYNRQNPLYYQVMSRQSGPDAGKLYIKQYSFFPVFPSISYTARF